MKKRVLVFGLFCLFSFNGVKANAVSELDTVYNDGEIVENNHLNPDGNPESQEVLETPASEGTGEVEENGVTVDLPEGIEYIPDGGPENGSPDSIIGADNRRIVSNTTVDPYTKVAFMIMRFPNGKSYVGSGNLISKDTVLTAGHCIYSKADGGWTTSVEVYPGYNGNTAPYGVAKAKRLMSVPGWTVNSSSQHDIGAIKLDRNIGNSVGWFGMTTVMENPITLSGYHADLNRKMGTQTGNISSLSDNNVYYPLDSTGGSSGSGVYNNKQQIQAVHAYGSTNYNFGTRMNTEKFKLAKEWIGDSVPKKQTSVTEVNKTVMVNNVWKSIDTIPWGMKGYVRNSVSTNYTGKVVTITQETADYSYSPELKGWIDKKGLVEMTRTNCQGYIKNAGYSIDQMPWYSGVVKLGTTGNHINEKVTVTAKSSGGYYYVANLGWIDFKAFNPELQKAVNSTPNTNVTTNTKRTIVEINTTALVIGNSKSIDSLPWGIKGYSRLGGLNDHAGKTISLTQEWGEYVYSPELKGWIDKKGLNYTVSN